MNQLILGDNLEIMRKMDDESIDLIYLDPPFFSNRSYEVIWGDKGEIRSFEDRWLGGIDHYIAWLKERVIEMHRLLKPTGTIFLHCDWHASHYIKVYILDKIFGLNNFRNEIVWAYLGPGSPGVKQFLKKHDTIFWYSKSNQWTFNLDLIRFKHNEKTKANFKKGLIGSGFNGAPRAINKKGKVPEDWWTDITISARYPKGTINNIGYPTQKPEKLLERIILASTNENDTVLDPFVGGGTTISVADRLKRSWLGIDQSVHAIKVSELRLNKQQNMFSAPFTVKLHKYDYDTLRYKDAFEFEKWIIERFDGIVNIKQRSDSGMDGKKRNGAPIQVKRSDNISRNVIDNFKSACERYDANLYAQNRKNNQPVGYIIAFSFGKGAIQEAARLKNEDNTNIELVRVDSIIPLAIKPPLTVEMTDLGTDSKGLRAIEFKAVNGENLAFYSWDFNFDNETKIFNPDVIRDMEGIQQYSFKKGNYSIAVKAVDNEGLETMEIINIRVNGGITV